MIKFTQYLLPHGERREIEMEVSDDIQAEADYLVSIGQKFDAEILTTGVVSFTCEPASDIDYEGKYFIKLSGNNPVEVPRIVAELVNEAYEALKVK